MRARHPFLEHSPPNLERGKVHVCRSLWVRCASLERLSRTADNRKRLVRKTLVPYIHEWNNPKLFGGLERLYLPTAHRISLASLLESINDGFESKIR